MLVLSRKNLQEIMVGNDVKITVLQIKGNTVRLGIEAPRHVRVRRGELRPAAEILSETGPEEEEDCEFEEVTFSLATDPDSPESSSRILPFQNDRVTGNRNIPDEAGGRLGRIREMLSKIRNHDGNS